VADQDQGASIVAQKTFEPQGCFEVEVIGRLVEQQQIGLGEQDRGKRRPHPPAARQLSDRLVLRPLVKPEPGEDARRPARRRMRRDFDEPRLDLGDPHCLRPGFPLGQQARPLAVSGEHRLERARRTTRRLLREKADAAAARQFDRPVIGLQDTADQVEKGRFARTVAADQPDLGPLGDLGIRLIEQPAPGTPADTVCHLGKAQHGGLLAQACGAGR
jgi:HAMP domain-containing protein